MMRVRIKTAQQLRTVGLIRSAYADVKPTPFFSGARMVALTATSAASNATAVKQIRTVTNNLRFYNQVVVKISLYHGAAAYRHTQGFHGHAANVKDFAAQLIDGALQNEIDREIAVMARGENVAANQRRQRVLGKYLLSKPYRVIKNFYGIGMQKLAAAIPAKTGRDGDAFHSDIIHERTDKTVYSTTQTQIERVSATPAHHEVISDGDLSRIATKAARQVEKKLRTERERNGKW